MKVYSGVRLYPEQGTISPVVVSVLDGERSYALRHDRCRPGMRWPCHSPDGFNWSFGGSGPAELAKYLCIDFFGPAWVVPAAGLAEPVIDYQDFKRDFVANFADSWLLDEVTIRAWLQRKIAERVLDAKTCFYCHCALYRADNAWACIGCNTRWQLRNGIVIALPTDA